MARVKLLVEYRLLGKVHNQIANPVYVDGRLVRSRFAAADAAGVSTVALWKALRKSGGAPCVVNGRSVFSAEWFEEFKRGEAGE